MSDWAFYLVSFVIVLVLGIGLYRHRRFIYREKLYTNFSKKSGLNLTYSSEKDFLLFGPYKGFDLRVEPFITPLKRLTNKAVKFSVNVNNPQLKSLRITNLPNEYQWMHYLAPVFDPVIAHPLNSRLEIRSNDPGLTGYILSDDIQIDLVEIMNRIDAGILYIQGNILAFICPHFLFQHADMPEVWAKIIHLLSDIKEELKGTGE